MRAEWIARKEIVQWVIHYLDDFLVMRAPGSDKCATAVKKLLEVFERLGLPVAPEKLEGPDTILVFLLFQARYDSEGVRLPQHKLAELKESIQQW